MAVTIQDIESGILTRLRDGLGRMVREVAAWGGEADDPAAVVRSLPAAWVGFGGVDRNAPYSTAKREWLVTGHFPVMVADYSSRSAAASRAGGAADSEVGVYRLIYAVRRLLSGQSLGLDIQPLSPGAVRPLYTSRTQSGAFALYALDYSTGWMEYALRDSHFPLPQSGSLLQADGVALSEPVAADDGGIESVHPDAIFTRWQGRLSPSEPWLTRVNLSYRSLRDKPVAADSVILNSETNGEINVNSESR